VFGLIHRLVISLSLVPCCSLVAEAQEPAPAPAPAEPSPHPIAEDELVAPVPWRVHGALGGPDWLMLGGSQRTRLAGLANQFRPGLGEHDRAITLRTLLTLGIRWRTLRVVGELQDARAFLTDEDSGISTIDVDTLEPLQAYAGLHLDDAIIGGDELDLIAGRQTMDLGGRRLVARNRYRDTIQGYTGVTLSWRASTGARLFVFAVLPVRVEPSNDEREALLDNRVELDRESLDRQHLSSLHVGLPCAAR